MIDDKFIAGVEGILPLVYDDSLSYYEVLEKVTNLLNECIQKVNNIADPVIYTPTVNEDGTISWTNNGGLPNPEPVDITGPIGPAPSISVTDITNGHRITIIDEEHPNGINIDVMNGDKGEQGDEGVSPTITITDVTGGHRITITDKNHPQGQSFDVMNGAKGETGDDGVSPTITITNIAGGHRIVITDKEHPSGQTFDVMNGEQGPAGQGVPAGGTDGDVLVKNGAADYAANWTNTPPQMGSLATIETSPATKAHAVGEYVVYNGQLYKVIAAISQGETLTPGSNIAATTVTDAMQVPSPLPIASGGTGASDIAAAKRNLNVVKTIWSGDDLDNYKGPESAGFYRIRNDVSHSPANWLSMIVLAGSYLSDGTTQVCFSGTTIFTRSYTGNPLAWSNWVSGTLN